ncbi:MAG: 16S rRNA (adenine(1518)-N(6)/adenine(1519)-N(6))-dimethyltransferase RsmA [Muribaculaceae bacterium]|nr:16S rRNA (adenine(1518)-N(6)/adenine(1519)-N(6))-dimethyltransferase RsmA [Muribaculaceae bacterium]
MQKVRPKKALGQHFLTDESIARRIAATLEPVSQLPVLEVGPGMGMLTHCLLDQGADVRVAEIDGESVEYLRNEYPALAQEGRIIEGDFLTLDLATALPHADKIAVIGNYPYNISSQIFFHVLEYKDVVQCCSGMLQREVAERIAAAPGCKARGILSVLLQAWYDVEYLFTVSEKVFNPPPKVKSGVICLIRNNVRELGCDERLFRTVVKSTFGQRRKMLRNTVRGLLPADAAPIESEMMQLRPEDLSVAQFIELTNLIEASQKR